MLLPAYSTLRARIRAGIIAVWMVATLIFPPALSAEDIQIVKISSQDQTAVVRMSARNLKMVRVGDRLGSLGTIQAISADWILLEGQGTEKIIVRFQDGVQTIEQIGNVRAAPAPAYQPANSP
jgi:hypothetical protein